MWYAIALDYAFTRKGLMVEIRPPQIGRDMAQVIRSTMDWTPLALLR